MEDEFLLAMDLELLLSGMAFACSGRRRRWPKRSGCCEASPGRGPARRQPARRAGDAGGGGAAGAGVPFVLASAYDHHGLAAVALAGRQPGKPTDERRLLAALAQAVAP